MQQIDVILAIPGPGVPTGLGETIGSVVAQGLRSWRLLVVAPPSVEGIESVIGRAAPGDGRVVVLRASGRSASALRNAGMHEAGAGYVGFLEPGDALRPNGLADLIAAAGAGRFGAACGSWLVADAGGAADGPPLDPPEGALGISEMESVLGLPAAGVVIERGLLEGRRFGANLGPASHTDLWLRLCEDGVRWQVTPSVVATVRHDIERGGPAEAERMEEIRSVIGRAFRRASARGWEAEVLAESNEASIVRAALFVETTRAALSSVGSEASDAAERFAGEGSERFLTPGALARATGIGLRYSPAWRAVIDGSAERAWAGAVHGWWSRCVTQKWIARHELDAAIGALAAELVDPRVVADELLGSFGSPGRLWVGGTDRAARAVIGAALDGGWRVLVIPGRSTAGVNTRLMALPSRVMVASGDEAIGPDDPLVIGSADEAGLLERYGARQNVARWNGAWRRVKELCERRLRAAWPRREM